MQCFDPSTRVYYPSHEEYTARGYCSRCGETVDSDLHRAWQAEQGYYAAARQRVRDADQLFMDGRVNAAEHIRRTSRR